MRTFVAAGVGAAAGWIFRTVGIDLTDLAPAIIDSLTGVVWALLTGAAQWALTRPGVEDWLRRYVPVLATGVHLEPAPAGPDGVPDITTGGPRV